MRNRLNTFLLLCSALAFASCGQEHKAKSIARDFISTYQVKGDRFGMSFSKLDSTKHIAKENIQAMRQHVSEIPQFQKGITFEKGDIPNTLLYITARYKVLTPQGDTLSCDNTFYFDQKLERIIAVK